MIPPVILRELRVASRRRETWNLRMAFVGGAAAAQLFGLAYPDVGFNHRGMFSLVSVTTVVFVFALMTGPCLTADAITSEKREGTLGLLFLTPLSATQIVLGKIATHSLHVATAVLAVLPTFFVPIMLGGVSWIEVCRLALVVGVTLMLSLACGIFWSTVRPDGRGAVLSTVATLLLLTTLPLAALALAENAFGASARAAFLLGMPSPAGALISAFERNFTRGAQGVCYGFSILGAVTAGLLIAASAFLLGPVWRAAELSGARAPETPAPSRARRSPRPSRPGSQPLLWLGLRDLRSSPGMPMLRAFGVCFFLLLLAIAVTRRTGGEPVFLAACFTAFALHLLARIEFALAATRRLHEDKRSGAFEMLCAAPMRDVEFVSAHHSALIAGFTGRLGLILSLNLVLFLTVVLFFEHLRMGGGAGLIFSTFFVGGALITIADFRAMRWLALRESLTASSPGKAAARVLLRVCVPAWVLFFVMLLPAPAIRTPESMAFLFLVWFMICFVLDEVQVGNARSWLNPGLRTRIAEG